MSVFLNQEWKWFNYGIIVVVMLLDLNMWKNQIFYQPADYGQYTTADHKVRTVLSPATLATGNRTLWTLQYRQSELKPGHQPQPGGGRHHDELALTWANPLSRQGARLPALPAGLRHVRGGVVESRNQGFSCSRLSKEAGASIMLVTPACMHLLFCQHTPVATAAISGLDKLRGMALTYLYGRFPPKTDATAGGRLRPSFRSSWRQGSRAPARAPAPARLVVCWDPQCGAATRATTSDQLAAAKGAPPR
ncbi:hypothetical protein HPB48_020673 [Haemaphysalis longicornis]|uniref:Uncharacterized protein n=1 Tax=Haemaphysalis longicornis TaxID=44386 RepID=A0A9J6GHH2_HAELO|nr:hypothetical protein HPB48_020673 [Haemaphysalis longicornis]